MKMKGVGESVVALSIYVPCTYKTFNSVYWICVKQNNIVLKYATRCHLAVGFFNIVNNFADNYQKQLGLSKSKIFKAATFHYISLLEVTCFKFKVIGKRIFIKHYEHEF